MINKIVYLNKQYLPEHEAKISVFDRGFMFADGIYEVIPVYENKVLFLQEHLERLQDNVNKLAIKYPIEFNEWFNICNHLTANNGANCPIYVQITRGADKIRRHDFKDNLEPTVLALSLEPVELGNSLVFAENNNITKPLKIITLPDNRWDNCDIKSIALLGNILLRQEGLKQGAEEVLLMRENGNIVEGTLSNYFIVKNNQVITPPLTNEMLPGITRKIIIKLCLENNIKIYEQNLKLTDLETADEIWLSSSTKEVRPVTIINNKIINNGMPGPLWHKVAKLYINHLKKLIQ